ncbi:MAG: L,D-transpeptidase [Ruminococcus sp.]|nr:L,D-transpeptidase [Ruminococcus sp.]
MPYEKVTSSSARPDVNFGTPKQRAAFVASSSAAKKSTAVKSNAARTNAAKKKKKKKKSNTPLIIVLVIIIIIIAAIVIGYFVGYNFYKNKFTANTYINGKNVSGKSLDEVNAMFVHDEIPDVISVTRPSGEAVEISLSAADYSYNYEDEIQKIYDDLDQKSWFAYLLKDTNYTFTDSASYDEDKLDEEIESADWGDIENQNAEIKSDDDGYYIIDEVQGDVFDMDTMKAYIAKCLDDADYEIDGLDSNAYIAPDTVASDYEAKVETLNKMWSIEIEYDFNYTTETLTGKKLCKMIKVKRDGSYTVDEDACMSYIEELAEKYDTYNTERKFHATLQGDITIPTSDDAKYGWWLDQQESCDQLVEMLEEGESQEMVEPIYYETGGYVFTGLASARTADDDIGDTYVEVDLTAQTFWYYEDGEMIRTGYIVSGQTTSLARTTLPGVYKVWYKATNYRMNDTNADGESWDTTCNYWTRVAIVGIGLHDTTTRTAFGGQIYKTNGSHGCINMTLSDAKFIYEEVEMDTPVVMYY